MTIEKPAAGPSRPRPPVRQGPAPARPRDSLADVGALLALKPRPATAAPRPGDSGSRAALAGTPADPPAARPSHSGAMLTPISSAELTPRSVRTPATLDGVGATVRKPLPPALARRRMLRAWGPTVAVGLLAAAVTLGLGALGVRTFLPTSAPSATSATGHAGGAAVEQAAASPKPGSPLPATAVAAGAGASTPPPTVASASALPATAPSASASAGADGPSGRRRTAAHPTTSGQGQAGPPSSGTGWGAEYLPGVL
jgi:hypothetical protein